MLCFAGFGPVQPNRMSVDRSTVERIALLARIAIPDERLDALTSDLARVIGLADALANAPIADLDPMAHPFSEPMVLREDVITESDQREAFLALSPAAQMDLYLVPKVIE